MKITYRFLNILTLSALFSFHDLARSEVEDFALECRKSASFLAPADGAEQRNYAPDRDLQILHLIIEVTPNFKERTITSKATVRFKPVVRPAREVKLDAVDLNVRAVTATEKIQEWQVTERKIIVTFAEPVAAEKEVTLTIAYSAEPSQGLYFRTPEMGYKEGDTHLFTQGEAIEARHWYPCLDTPNQQFTSEIICHVPQGMTAVSNGRLVSESKDPSDGLTAIHWAQEKPHANYLISLVAGYFKKLEDTCHGLPLAFYTPPSEIEYAKTSFRDTKDMIAFFEQEIGVPYPWPKYSQVCVNDFVAGGMENTSATTLTDGTLFTDATENIRNSEGLVAHELAHQWFGDLVTCKDWSHLWLNEGFATYYESLWNAQHNGRDNMLYELYGRARQITGMNDDEKPIVRRTYKGPDEMFGYLVYPKASWVLHMLRCELGENLYQRCIKTYLERHRHGNVVTDDLRAVVEELSGRSFDQFFDQWLYHGRFPELEISYSWDEPSKLAKISIQQNQQVNVNVLLFDFPLTVRFKSASGTDDRVIEVSKKQEDFYFTLPAAPELVRVDPEYTLLAKIRYNLPGPMLYAQFADKNDAVGRLLAIEQLAGRKDKEAIAKLKEALNQDTFYGVRVEAANALRGIHNEEALDALLASTKQPDARVRRQVVDNIGAYYDEKSREFGRQVLGEEKNPEIVTTALRDLGGYTGPELRELLVKYLNSDSYRNELADAAIGAMRSQDDPAFIVPLLENLSHRQAAFTSYGFAQGLGTLAYLARNEDKKDDVRVFLLSQVNNKKRTVQITAINALGTLGDPKAISALGKFATATKESPQRSAAEQAVASLRAARKPIDDFKNLRQEVLDLQKSNRDLRKELDDLKKKVEAGQSARSVEPHAAKTKAQPPKVSPKAGGQ